MSLGSSSRSYRHAADTCVDNTRQTHSDQGEGNPVLYMIANATQRVCRRTARALTNAQQKAAIRHSQTSHLAKQGLVSSQQAPGHQRMKQNERPLVTATSKVHLTHPPRVDPSRARPGRRLSNRPWASREPKHAVPRGRAPVDVVAGRAFCKHLHSHQTPGRSKTHAPPRVQRPRG